LNDSTIFSDLFLQWIQNTGIKDILHGHKHIPKIQDHEGIKLIGAGSATGTIKHSEKNKTYISYNIIKNDNLLKRPISCSIYVEEILGAGVQHVQLMPL
jgi:desulfoferrodoxin (superoxide reductase-like protein)